MDGKAHHFEALYHLDAEEVAVEGLRVTTKNNGPNLTLISLGPEDVRIIKGQKAPVVQGWLPEAAQGYGGIRPIPTAVFSKQASGKARFYTVLYPTRTGAVCPVREVKMVANGLTLLMADGSEKMISTQ